MEIGFTEEQAMFRSTVREFVDREVAPRAEQLDEEAVFPTDLFDRMGAMGFYGLRYPEELGGLGSDFKSYCILAEELARGSPGVSASEWRPFGLPIQALYAACGPSMSARISV